MLSFVHSNSLRRVFGTRKEKRLPGDERGGKDRQRKKGKNLVEGKPKYTKNTHKK